MNILPGRYLHVWLAGLFLACAGWPSAWAGDSVVAVAQNQTRLAQDSPARPGMMVPEARMLAISVVPELRGRAVPEARELLAKSGLQLGKVVEVAAQQASGTVVRQSPAANAKVDRGSSVNVWVAQAGPVPSTDQVRVPDVVERPVRDAESILVKSGLRLGEVAPRPSDAPRGTVLSQSPAPGQRVDRGSPVSVSVAEAPGLEVPRVIGRPLPEAEAILAKAGLRMREAGREVSRQPEGAVARQSPGPGEGAARGSVVDVWVAVAAAVPVPDVRGLPIGDADQRLRKSRLSLGIRSEGPSLPPAGHVIDQKPAAGAEVAVGARVDVIVGDGSRTEVPGIVGQSEGAALERLDVADLRPGKRGTEESVRPEGEVLRQRPAPGSVVARGSRVAYAVAVPQGVAVPRIVGLTAGEALGRLERLGLAGQEEGADASDRPEGEILRQAPEPGARVPRGSRVGFRVAAPVPAPTPVTVPDLAGLQGSEVRERLRAAGLAAGAGRNEQSREPPGAVVRQEPAAGVRVRRGTRVDYWTAVPMPVRVPQLVGVLVEDARVRLSGLDLVMVALTPEASDAPEGIVIGQMPAAGTPVAPGAEIVLRISAGTALSPWIIGGGIGAVLLAVAGGLWLARRPPRSPSRPATPPPAVTPRVRVHMDTPDAGTPEGLALDPKIPTVGVRTRLLPGDSEVSADGPLVVREERRES